MLHESQKVSNADQLIDQALSRGLSYQGIAALTGVSDTAVRAWHRKKIAKRSAIQPLIDHLSQKEPSQFVSGVDDKKKFTNLISTLEDRLVSEIDEYMTGNRQQPPLELAQLVGVLKNIYFRRRV